MTTPILYGIKNCDTVKKARKWLETNGINYQFHDFRTDGLTPALLEQWLQDADLGALVNKRSTTWKNLTENDRQRIFEGDAKEILQHNPTLIKRPVIAYREQLLIGFREAQYAELMLASC